MQPVYFGDGTGGLRQVHYRVPKQAGPEQRQAIQAKVIGNLHRDSRDGKYFDIIALPDGQVFIVRGAGLRPIAKSLQVISREMSTLSAMAAKMPEKSRNTPDGGFILHAPGDFLKEGITNLVAGVQKSVQDFLALHILETQLAQRRTQNSIAELAERARRRVGHNLSFVLPKGNT